MANIFKLAFIALVIGAGMASCSTKVIDDEPQPVNPTQETRTINVRVVSNDYTRAADDDAIETLYLAFYKSGNPDQLIAIEQAELKEETYAVNISIDPLNLPDKMIAVANISDKASVEEALNNNSISGLKENDKLIMSNAVYYDEKDNNKLINCNYITSSNILSGTPVEVFLERVAAKVIVKTPDEKGLTGIEVIDAQGTSKLLKLRIEKWDINATDNESFLLKQITPFSELTYLPEETPWNEPAVHKSHWALSKNYGHFSDNTNIRLLKFQDIANDPGDKSFYFHETTRSESDLNNKNNSKPVIVLTGKYTYDDEGNPGTFYRLRAASNESKDKIFKEDEIKSEFLSKQDIIFTNQEHTTLETAEELSKIISLSSPSNDIADNYVTPQIDSNTELEENKYFNIEGKAYTKETLNQALYKRFGLVEKYDQGRCWFIIPVEHKYNNLSNLYGLVRNHQYTITISSISGFGIGVGSDKSDITDKEPPEISHSYTINASLTVNSWTEINQDISIAESK